jgi:PKD repeat protein
MKRSHLYLLLLVAFTIFGCPNDDALEVIPVVADFTADNASPEGITILCGECITFKDESSGRVRAYFWDFPGGDPLTSEDKQVVVCYDQPGIYDVSLSVNVGEDRITKADYVTVLGKEPLTANFSVDQEEIIQEQEIQLTDESTGNPEAWAWTISSGMGDPQTSTDQNPIITIPDPGIYTIKLTVSRDNETSTEEKPDFINVLGYQDFKCLINSTTITGGLLFTNTYNELDQLIRLEESENGELFSFHTYTWNAQGLLDEVESFNADQSLLGSETYDYDTQGDLTQQSFLDEEGNILSDYNFVFEGNRITGGTLTVTDGQGGFIEFDLEYNYDQTGNVIEEIIRDQNLGGQLQRITFEFDEWISSFSDIQVQPFPFRMFDHNVTRCVVFDFEDNPISEIISTYEYNEYGRAKSEERTSGTTIQEFVWDYNCFPLD